MHDSISTNESRSKRISPLFYEYVLDHDLDNEPVATVVVDMVTDLLHFWRKSGEWDNSFEYTEPTLSGDPSALADEILNPARYHFEAEVVEEGESHE